MSEGAIILVLFVTLTAVITFTALLINSRVRAGMKLPGRAEFYIDTTRGEWHQRSKKGNHKPPPRKSPPKSRYYLEMKLRNRPNWIYPLSDKRHVYIGRRADNDIVLTDPTADTRQAVIYWENGRYKINNLSARTPTQVNGHIITKQNVGDGNTIQLGQTKLIFRDRNKR